MSHEKEKHGRVTKKGKLLGSCDVVGPCQGRALCDSCHPASLPHSQNRLSVLQTLHHTRDKLSLFVQKEHSRSVEPTFPLLLTTVTGERSVCEPVVQANGEMGRIADDEVEQPIDQDAEPPSSVGHIVGGPEVGSNVELQDLRGTFTQIHRCICLVEQKLVFKLSQKERREGGSSKQMPFVKTPA